MESVISKATVELVANLTGPLVGTGALHRTEQQSVVQLLRQHTAGKQPDQQADAWSTLDEASRETKLSKKTLRRMIDSGELEGKYLRKGSPKTLRIKSSSLAALKAQEGDPSHEAK